MIHVAAAKGEVQGEFGFMEGLKRGRVTGQALESIQASLVAELEGPGKSYCINVQPLGPDQEGNPQSGLSVSFNTDFRFHKSSGSSRYISEQVYVTPEGDGFRYDFTTKSADGADVPKSANSIRDLVDALKSKEQ